jgi:UDP-2,3-diacylglucosamine pyrophosphatase LpxH
MKEGRVTQSPQIRNFRAIFISDVHLGTRGAKAGMLLDFLKYNEADYIYLVGDIVDGWRLRRGWFWPQAHNDVVQKLLRKGRKGSKLIYIPGNHDEFLRDYVDMAFGTVQIADSVVHESAAGKRYLVMHGDQFDVVVRYARWLAFLGDRAYEITLRLNTYVNILRRKLGLQYWSLSAWAKLKVKNAVNFIGEFEQALTSEARRRDVDGIICGHIHHANDVMINSVHYINCGDWVESCTALVEHHDGRFEILRWGNEPPLMLPLQPGKIAA